MSDTKDKNRLAVKRIEVSRGITVKIGPTWKRADIRLVADVTYDTVKELCMHGDALSEHAERQLEKWTKPKVRIRREDLNWKPESLAWARDVTGPKGKYDRSYDRTNPEHKRIVEDLKSRKQPFEFNGYIYWVLGDNTLGRKKIATKA